MLPDFTLITISNIFCSQRDRFTLRLWLLRDLCVCVCFFSFNFDMRAWCSSIYAFWMFCLHLCINPLVFNNNMRRMRRTRRKKREFGLNRINPSKLICDRLMYSMKMIHNARAHSLIMITLVFFKDMYRNIKIRNVWSYPEMPWMLISKAHLNGFRIRNRIGLTHLMDSQVQKSTQKKPKKNWFRYFAVFDEFRMPRYHSIIVAVTFKLYIRNRRHVFILIQKGKNITIPNSKPLEYLWNIYFFLTHNLNASSLL